MRGKFRVRGDVVEIHPAYDETAVRVEFFGDDVEAITVVDPLTGEKVGEMDELVVFPNTHYATSDERIAAAISRIELELQQRLAHFESEGKLLEAQRLRMRTEYDLEMLQEMGFCNGIENYSAPIDGRSAGEPPYTLLDFFPADYLTIVDESHVADPPAARPVRGRSVAQGGSGRARVPAAIGCRQPAVALRGVVASAQVRPCSCPPRPGTGSSSSSTNVVEQIVRPTGLIDPEVLIKPDQGSDR